MADKKVQPITTGNDSVDDAIEKARDFWERFSRIITIVSTVVILLLGGWWIYRTYIQLPMREKADNIIFPAENLFDQMSQQGFNSDSINLVLNGGDNITGVLKIANTYGSSPAGNRAKLIAGACYLHNKDFTNAIKYLKEFSSTKATQIQSVDYSLLGDAYAELNNQDEAFDYYKKAAEVNDKDEDMTPFALYKEGMYAEKIGKKDEAIAIYETIRDKYPKSPHAADMDKYLARLGVFK